LRHAQRDRIFANRTELLAQMIEAGLGYSVLSESFAKSYIKQGCMHVLNHGASYAQQLVCAWSPQEMLPDYLQAVIDVLQ
jgi:LysR family transcriptional regulator, chromosome initiation inhibitor